LGPAAAIPVASTSTGNIILGGDGSDIIEGNGGDGSFPAHGQLTIDNSGNARAVSVSLSSPPSPMNSSKPPPAS